MSTQAAEKDFSSRFGGYVQKVSSFWRDLYLMVPTLPMNLAANTFW
jgi:hypothetical protein